MKIRSTRPLPYDADRLGIKIGIIEIDLTIINKDDVQKTYTLKAVDYVVMSETSAPVVHYPGMIGMTGKQYLAEKLYTKSYAEYDAQRDYLKSLDVSGLTGSELDDKLLQDALLYSAMTDTIYESTYEDWTVYSEPIIVVMVPILDVSDGKMVSGEAEANTTVALTITQDMVVSTTSVITGQSGQFAYIPYPVLVNGATVTAIATNMMGLSSTVSETLTVVVPVEPTSSTV